MSNVWKRYLFADPVTYSLIHFGSVCKSAKFLATLLNLEIFRLYGIIMKFIISIIISLKVEEQKASDQLQRTQELDDNYTEMANNIHGNMLTENPSCATSAFGNHR